MAKKKSDPCWTGYKQVGMKKKGGKQVPNCVPANEETILEKNVPTNPGLWSKMKSRAKSKFDVYPSAYANGWASKEYKKAGGGWKTAKESFTLEDADGNTAFEVTNYYYGEGYDKPDEKLKTDRDGYRVSEKDAADAKERILAKAREKRKKLKEDLRDWFGDGPKGGWDRYNTKGEKVGKCARDDKDGDGKGDGPKPKCLSNEKASKMSKGEIASSVKSKRKKDGDADRKGAPINVKNKGLDEQKGYTVPTDQIPTDPKKLEQYLKRVNAGELTSPSPYEKKGSEQASQPKEKPESTQSTQSTQQQSGVSKAEQERLRKEAERRRNAGQMSDLRGGPETRPAPEPEKTPEQRMPTTPASTQTSQPKTEPKTEPATSAVNPPKPPTADPPAPPRPRTSPSGSKPSTPFKSSRLNKALTGIQAGSWKKRANAMESNDLDEACWKGYRKRGMKKKGDRMVPNCVKEGKKSFSQFIEEADKKSMKYCNLCKKDETRDECSYGGEAWDKNTEKAKGMSEAAALAPILVGAGKAAVKGLVGMGVKRLAAKGMGAAALNLSGRGGSTPQKDKKNVKESAWQRKEGKNKAGGLNEKGRKSYERENPGSDLKAPVTKEPSKLDPDSKSAKRRKSFCARMGGMPGPMKDDKGKPTRKALSLRKWNC